MEKHPSSTSSSKPAGKRRVIPWVLVGVLGILIGLEIGVFRQRWFWAAEPRSDVGIYYVLEDMARSSKVRPKILIFGDSRMRLGVDAFLLEQELGLKRGEVMNFALTAGTPWDTKLFFKRNPWLLDSLQLILYQPSDWQFNENFPPTSRVKHFATLGERIEYKDFETACELVAGYFLQTVAAKDVFKGNIKRVGSTIIKKLTNKYTKDLPLVDTVTGQIRWMIKEQYTGPDTVDITADISSFYKKFEYSQRVENDLTDIINLSKDRKIKFVLVDIPVREIYVQTAESKYGRYSKKYLTRLEALCKEFDVFQIGDSATKNEALITENLFYDYGHLTLEGKKRFTVWFAKKLTSDSLF